MGEEKEEYLANGAVNPMKNPNKKQVFKIERPLTKSQKSLIKLSKICFKYLRKVDIGLQRNIHDQRRLEKKGDGKTPK